MYLELKTSQSTTKEEIVIGLFKCKLLNENTQQFTKEMEVIPTSKVLLSLTIVTFLLSIWLSQNNKCKYRKEKH